MRRPTPIIDLDSVSSLSSGDQIPIYSANNGDARRIPASALATYVAGQVSTVDGKVTQYASPLTGATVTIAPASTGGSVFLLLQPAGTIATLTVVLPAAGIAVDKQEVMVSTTNTVTALTVFAGGTTLAGAPTTITAAAPFKMRYDGVNSIWMRVV